MSLKALVQEELKQLDEKVSKINDPFGVGLPILRNVIWEIAHAKNTSCDHILEKYLEWKSKTLV